MKLFVTDMDDVLVDLLKTWVTLLNIRYNKNVKIEDIKEWDMKKSYPDLTDKELYGILNEEELWKSVTPKKNSQQFLEKIKNSGYKVFVCTATHYKNISTKITECLLKYYPWITYKDIIMCHNKSMVMCDYIVDDYHENIKDSKAIRFLIDAPYNQDAVKGVHYDFRVPSMKEVYKIITKLDS